MSHSEPKTLTATEIAELTDAALELLISRAAREHEARQRERERDADLERRRASIRAGKGDPGPGERWRA
jgi:hypothetical protein